MKKIIMKLFSNKMNGESCKNNCKCDACGYKQNYEELEIKYNSLLEENYNLRNKIKTIKAETAKEIAKSLKKTAVSKCFDPLIGIKMCISEHFFINLIKEMESEG